LIAAKEGVAWKKTSPSGSREIDNQLRQNKGYRRGNVVKGGEEELGNQTTSPDLGRLEKEDISKKSRELKF